MWQTFQEGGVMMWPLLILAVTVVVLTVRGWVRVSHVDGPDPVVETGVDAVVFWGAWSVVLGLLGTIVGIYIAAGFIEAAPAVSPQIIWGGIRVALTTLVFGLLIFAVSAVAWFVLRTRYRRGVG
ncbi:MAG TPA: MotA/TolQ/ExbB proton channel family protein [Longimicrobiales bacterium]|nr:MotA/TolQ/ExbB proton channel family protein [Longimicrobiales bacterium]